MERLDKILVSQGIGSRKEVQKIIRSKRVSVDGEIITKPDFKLDAESSHLTLDGQALEIKEHIYIMLNKPAGVLSSMSDPFGGRTVADLIRGQVAERLVPVGRLDKDSEGLLLMSNDGDLTLRLTHPRYDHEKTYIVKVAGRWSEEKLAVLRAAVRMPDGYVIRPVPVKVIRANPDHTTVLEFRLREGRKRQIRYMCSAAHLVVISLKRVAIGAFRLPDALAPGDWRDLTADELAALRADPS